jgi:predicted nucleotidyltransferase
MLKELNMLKPFFESPNSEFNVRQIARILKIAPATASKELKALTSSKVLLENKERGFNLYRARLEDDSYKDLKVFYNIKKMKGSGVIEEINKFYLKPTIILYGSFSKGTYVEQSDIDLVVVSENEKQFTKLKEFEKKLGREIQLFVVKDLKDLKNKFLIANVLNGIVLQGEIRWT